MTVTRHVEAGVQTQAAEKSAVQKPSNQSIIIRKGCLRDIVKRSKGNTQAGVVKS